MMVLTQLSGLGTLVIKAVGRQRVIHICCLVYSLTKEKQLQSDPLLSYVIFS